MPTMKKTISGVTIECIKGNITSQADVTAIVNAANAQLGMGGGVAGAFGYPVEEAAEVAFRTIIEIVPELRHVKGIRFVLYSNRGLDIHEKIFSCHAKFSENFLTTLPI